MTLWLWEKQKTVHCSFRKPQKSYPVSCPQHRMSIFPLETLEQLTDSSCPCSKIIRLRACPESTFVKVLLQLVFLFVASFRASKKRWQSYIMRLGKNECWLFLTHHKIIQISHNIDATACKFNPHESHDWYQIVFRGLVPPYHLELV